MKITFFTIFLSTIVSLLHADMIYLKDKSVINGEILNNNTDDIELKTPYLGVLKIEKKDVEKIDLTTGNEQLKADLETDTKYFNPNMIIWKYEKALTGENRPVTLEEDKNRWLYRFDLDWNARNGNSDSRAVAGVFHAKYEDGNFRINTSLEGEHETSHEHETQNNMKYLFQYEDKDEPHSWYSTTEARYNKAQNLEYRVIESAGYVHYFHKDSDLELRIRAGGFISTERFLGQDEKYPAGLDLGFYGFYIFKNTWKVVSDLGYKIDAGDAENYDSYFESFLEIPLKSDKLWSLKLGMRSEYDNQVPEDIEQLETRYYLRLSMGWFEI